MNMLFSLKLLQNEQRRISEQVTCPVLLSMKKNTLRLLKILLVVKAKGAEKSATLASSSIDC